MSTHANTSFIFSESKGNITPLGTQFSMKYDYASNIPQHLFDPEDVTDVHAHGKLRMFRVKPRCDYNRHVMLHPTQYPDVKIQISRYAANIWGPSFHRLDEIEDLLNEIFGDSSNPEPFGERDIVFGPGELRKINETFLGKLNIFAYFYPEEIAEAVYCYFRCVDRDSWAVTPKTRSDLGAE